jgi:electron transfer flavoprotein beta subunit
MNIFVLIKQVPGTSNVKMDAETGTMIRTEHENVINPLDENALEEALRLKQVGQGVSVVAISMGPPPAMKALREALAIGADSAVLLCGRGFAGSDTLATARALAGGIRHLASAGVGRGEVEQGAVERDSIILCGERATDGETGQVGPMVAALMGVPVATYAKGIELELDEMGDPEAVVVERVVEEGFERVKLKLPCVVTVVKDINRPSFPTLAGKMRARDADVRVISPEELGLDSGMVGLSGSPTRVVRIFKPSFARNTVLRVHDESGAAVDSFIDLVRERGII